MERLEFNQENVDLKISEIKEMPETERREIADSVKTNLRAWLLQTFEFTDEYQKRMALWPLSMREETGFGIGTALLYDDWELIIGLPDTPPPPAKSRTKHEQSVSGAYNTSTGGYTVTKKHTWSW